MNVFDHSDYKQNFYTVHEPNYSNTYENVDRITCRPDDLIPDTSVHVVPVVFDDGEEVDGGEINNRTP